MTEKQKAAARQNIAKARAKWQSMSKGARSRSQPVHEMGDTYHAQDRPHVPKKD